MHRCISASWPIRRAIRLLPALGLLALVLVPSGAQAHSPLSMRAPSTTNNNLFCSRLGKSIQASSGAQMWCFGPQPNGGSSSSAGNAKSSFNVDAANPAEDRTPSGVQVYGQSEVSIAGVGPYVVEAWNDATGFFSPCPSPQNKEELTGFGFSADGGKSFVDEGGLPNTNCATDVYFGDPSVAAWAPGGTAYFYISSLYDSPTFTGVSYLAMAACQATGTGTAATLSCGQPTIITASTDCTFYPTCSFLDKDFLAIDPAHGRLYVAYTEFGFSGGQTEGQIELAVCDIGTPSGGIGPAGGTPGAPVCEGGIPAPPGGTGTPYFIVAPGPTCENEGAYPAVDIATGDVYTGYEFNWATNFLTGAPCNSIPTANVLAYVPFSCLTLTPTSPCSAPAATTSVSVVSLDAAFIPGYNRFPANDFPRLAVSDQAGTVSMVWNDASLHVLGDIFLQSFDLASLTPVQSVPVRLNSDTSGGLHFLPALRNVNAAGNLNVSWYERSSPTTALTNVFAALNVNPRTTRTPAHNMRVTTVASDWTNTSSDIIPNFGDYTDNDVIATPGAPYTGATLYIAWSDGRIGEPQPFEAHVTTR
jgi:hypothetical protein